MTMGQSSGLIRETTSTGGHRVTLTIEQASYQGALAGPQTRDLPPPRVIPPLGLERALLTLYPQPWGEMP